jgi:hypothetical protein
MLSTADKASPSGRAHDSEQGHSPKMADEILDALQKIDARVASIETTLHKVEHDISGVKVCLERIEHYTGLVSPLPS